MMMRRVTGNTSGIRVTEGRLRGRREDDLTVFPGHSPVTGPWVPDGVDLALWVPKTSST
jgi:hypothetical protein